jgi:hypothetical protein
MRLIPLGCVVGCEPVTLADHDQIYSHGADSFVLCSESVDDYRKRSTADIADALARAKDEGTTVHLYAHDPGDTIALAAIEGMLAAATAHDVAFITYEELTAHPLPGSLALSFDDNTVVDWTAIRPLLTRYHAQVTFFVSGFPAMTADDRAALRALADDGHDIEYHSVAHLDANDYVAMHGIDAYLADDILPGLDLMRSAGYAPTVFAYPYGARSDETDAALAPYFTHLRATRTSCPHP